MEVLVKDENDSGEEKDKISPAAVPAAPHSPLILDRKDVLFIY
jgi:hypothetical protein